MAPDRIRKDTDENKELARNLKRDSDASRRVSTSKPSTTKRKGEDFGDEKTTGRGKRTRDFELETVSVTLFLHAFASSGHIYPDPDPAKLFGHLSWSYPTASPGSKLLASPDQPPPPSRWPPPGSHLDYFPIAVALSSPSSY